MITNTQENWPFCICLLKLQQKSVAYFSIPVGGELVKLKYNQIASNAVIIYITSHLLVL